MLVPRTEKQTISSVVDLFLLENLVNLEKINLPAFMLEHMHMVITWKQENMEFPMGIF